MHVLGQISTGSEPYILTTPEGLIDGSRLAAGSVGPSRLATGAVTETGIASGAVSTAKIVDGAVTAAKIGDSAVGTSKLVDGAVTSGKIDSAAVTETTIADGAVTTDKLGGSAVTNGKIGIYAVSTAELAPNAVNASKIADGQVGNADLASNAVTSAKIADGTVTSADIADGVITSLDVLDGSLTGTDIQDVGIGTADLADSLVTTTKIANAAVSAAKLDTTATYRIGKLGVYTDVPHGGVGYARVAIHGIDNSLDAPLVQFTTSADAYPVLALVPYKHNQTAIRFDSYMGPNEGSGIQRSSLAASNAQILKANDVLSLGYSSQNDPGDPFYWTTGFSMDCTDGTIKMQQVYDATVGATRRDLYIDDTGKLGYISSSIEVKENVRNTAEQDTAFIYNLRPVMYDYRNHELGTNQCGLIAEEVAAVCPRAVSYKREVTYEPLDPDDASGTPEATVTTTNVPETVNYNELIVPMLAEMQRLQNRVQELETRLAALENK